jgi:putative membrane protein insertion efficiency factor|tara:strand:+ start:962 stop:1225 length:264 start_codon:yes stop_codon:yes gene_type:complete
MSKVAIFFIISLIKFYKYFFSPILGNRCRYLPTCSEYFVDALKTHGLFKGCWIGIRRIFSCHPIKLLGGGSGIDFVTKKDNRKNTNG